MKRAGSLEKTVMLEKIEGRRRRGQQRMRWLGSITDLMDVNLNELRRYWRTEEPDVLQVIGCKSWTQLSD